MTTAIIAAANFPVGLNSPSPSAIIPSITPASNDEFDTLTELLDPIKKAEVLEKIGTLENKEANLAKVIELANTHDFQSFSDFFISPQFEYYALAGVKEGKITAMQFGTLMYVRAGLSKGVKIEDLQVVPLFDKDAPSAKALEYIKATLRPESPDFSVQDALDEQQLTQFFEIMRTLPISEQYLVIIPDTRDFTQSRSNVSLVISQEHNFNVFCGLEINEKKMRMIHSMGMIKALIDATGTDGFTFKLVIGPSTPKSLKFSILEDNAREMCIHCDEIAPAPSTADGIPAPALDFMYHDLYHLWVCRHIVKEHRKFFCELAEVFNPDKFSSAAAKSAAMDLYAMLVDLDMGSYRPDIAGLVDIDQVSSEAMRLQFESLSARRSSREHLSTEEQLQSDIICNEFKGKINTLMAIWKLLKKDYSKFEEITDIYGALDPQSQKEIGDDFLEFEANVRNSPEIVFTPEEFAKLKLNELGEAIKLINDNRCGLIDFAESGVPFTLIWRLDPTKRETFLNYSFRIRQLIQCGIPFESIAEMDTKILAMFTEGFFAAIAELSEKGIEFKKITELLSKISALYDTENSIIPSFRVSAFTDLINADRIDDFLELEPRTFGLVYQNALLSKDLIIAVSRLKKSSHLNSHNWIVFLPMLLSTVMIEQPMTISASQK